MYFDKKVERGYNAYLTMGVNDHETGMDVGLLVMEAGDEYIFDESEKELAIDLLQGKVEMSWNGQTMECDRPDTFHYDAYCLHVCKGTKVVIKEVASEETTASGIVLPGSAQEKPQVAEVLAVGPGSEDVKMELQVGDRVIFSKYAGTEVKYNGEEVIILDQRDILAVVE